MFYPRIMLTQIMWKLEKTVKDLEDMSNGSKRFLTREVKGDKKVQHSIDRFYEFFLIPPVSLDPAGVVKKIDHLVQGQRKRFIHFAKQIAPHLDEEGQASIEMGLAGGITLHQLSKIVRHYVEVVRKTKSFQIAMILQMQLPLIERMARSIAKGTKAMTQGNPIGDALGPYVVAKLIGRERIREFGEDMVLAKKEMKGRTVFLMKAKGPGGRLGRPGLAISDLIKGQKVAKIISVDAAAKLEGEKTGSVAEGVGVAMGGVGVERNYIEEVAVRHSIPLDSVIVKMSSEEAIEPLRKKIIAAYPQVVESIERSLLDSKKGSKVLIIGVGNTSGVGNDAKAAEALETWVGKYERHLREQEQKKKK